jgi:dienelactone hydrolase
MAETAKRRDIEFVSGGVTLRGWLRLPEGPGPHPLVILAHGLGGLKEWTIPEVADVFVAAGFAALAFDYRNFGDSDGLPREEVDHCGQIEDWRSAITFGMTLPEIDAERIGLWGTSLGGRNVLAVAALDRRVSCVVAQVPAIAGDATLGAYMATGGDLAAFLQALSDDRRDRALGREPRYIAFENDPNTEHGGYWATFGEAERRNWNPRVTLRSLEPSLASNIMHLMGRIAPTPLMMIVADQDTMCPTEGQLRAFAAAGEPKSLVVVKGHHYCAYLDRKPEAVEAARAWFARHLGAQR